MNKKDANQVRPLVQSVDAIEALQYYVDLRVSTLKDSLISLEDLGEIRRVQGAIQELRRLKNIREEVLNPNGE